jgi:hypothetical protein
VACFSVLDGDGDGDIEYHEIVKHIGKINSIINDPSYLDENEPLDPNDDRYLSTLFLLRNNQIFFPRNF